MLMELPMKMSVLSTRMTVLQIKMMVLPMQMMLMTFWLISMQSLIMLQMLQLTWLHNKTKQMLMSKTTLRVEVWMTLLRPLQRKKVRRSDFISEGIIDVNLTFHITWIPCLTSTLMLILSLSELQANNFLNMSHLLKDLQMRSAMNNNKFRLWLKLSREILIFANWLKNNNS